MNEPMQKKLFSEKSQGLGSLVPQTIDLFMSGLQWLRVLSDKEHHIRFSKWSNLVKEAEGKRNDLNLYKLEWLWRAMTSEPDIRDFMGSRIISLDEEWRKFEPIEAEPPNSDFGIFFKGFSAYGYPVVAMLKDIAPDAEARILSPLLMKPGKGRRLECCDVNTLLEVHPPQVGDVDDEVKAFKVTNEDIRIEKGSIYIEVKSLNHAYTKASLRLQPHRRGPGGRAYDHVALKTENGYKPLEAIRREVEKKLWDNLFKA